MSDCLMLSGAWWDVVVCAALGSAGCSTLVNGPVLSMCMLVCRAHLSVAAASAGGSLPALGHLLAVIGSHVRFSR